MEGDREGWRRGGGRGGERHVGRDGERDVGRDGGVEGWRAGLKEGGRGEGSKECREGGRDGGRNGGMQCRGITKMPNHIAATISAATSAHLLASTRLTSFKCLAQQWPCATDPKVVARLTRLPVAISRHTT